MATEDPLVARLTLEFDGKPVVATFTVPAGPVGYRCLQKVAQDTSDLINAVAQTREENEGRTISCTKGCAACCRHLVPLALSEAQHLAALVDAMPEPRRTRVRDRFALALRRATEAGLMQPLLRRSELTADELLAAGLAYFREWIDCPFLENESCLIHAERPMACREFLVTSPAVHCRTLEPGRVQSVKLPAHVSRVVREMDGATYGTTAKSAWVPLFLVLEWAASHPQEPPQRPGPELLQAFVQALLKQAAEGRAPGQP